MIDPNNLVSLFPFSLPAVPHRQFQKLLASLITFLKLAGFERTYSKFRETRTLSYESKRTPTICPRTQPPSFTSLTARTPSDNFRLLFN